MKVFFRYIDCVRYAIAMAFGLGICLGSGFGQEVKTPPAYEQGTGVAPLIEGNKPESTESDPDEADQVRLDKTLDWLKSVEDAAPLRGADKNEDEHRAYNYVVAHARKQAPAALARQALRNIPFSNLVDDIRQDYRYDLIHMEGRLVRIDLVKPTDMLAQTTDIRQLYEVWLFPLERANEGNPMSLVVSELPPGVKTGREVNYWVQFDAYYFKLLKYESGQKLTNGKFQWRVAPLFLGRTFSLLEPPSNTFNEMFVPSVVTVIAIVVASALGITWYFRSGDRAVREQLREAQTRKNPFSDVVPGSEWTEKA